MKNQIFSLITLAAISVSAVQAFDSSSDSTSDTFDWSGQTSDGMTESSGTSSDSSSEASNNTSNGTSESSNGTSESTSGAAYKKEVLEKIQEDAFEFIAGEAPSALLLSAMEVVKKKQPELQGKSEEQVARATIKFTISALKK